MIVDQTFFTVGSANFVDISLEKDHTELNVSVWDEKVARNFLEKLFMEHLGKDISRMVKNGGEKSHSFVLGNDQWS